MTIVLHSNEVETLPSFGLDSVLHLGSEMSDSVFCRITKLQLIFSRSIMIFWRKIIDDLLFVESGFKSELFILLNKLIGTSYKFGVLLYQNRFIKELS